MAINFFLESEREIIDIFGTTKITILMENTNVQRRY